MFATSKCLVCHVLPMLQNVPAMRFYLKDEQHNSNRVAGEGGAGGRGFTPELD